MQPVIRIGRAFSPWAVALSVPRALPWAGIGARRWRLRPSQAIRRVWILGSVTTSAVALSVPRALPWAGIGARRWRLRRSELFFLLPGCLFCLGRVGVAVS